MTSEPLDPARTALIIVDLQQRIVDLSLGPSTGKQIVAQAVRLADEFRARGGLVVIVQVERPGVAEQPPGSELVPALVPQPGDVLITKQAWSAFHQTGLDERLRARSIATLVLTGISTNHGVESTARSAADYGYRLIFPVDAMTGLDSREHDFAVSSIFPRLGEVCPSSDVLDRLTVPSGTT
jgi:nicotinamidase-related amidase